MAVRIPPRVEAMDPYVPQPDTFRVKLDANESFVRLPLGLRLRLAFKTLSLPYNRYPDPDAVALCGRAASCFGVEPACVVAGNGSDELLGVAFSAFADPGDGVLVFEPDFSMYRFYAHLYGLTLVNSPRMEDGLPDFEAAKARIAQGDIRIAVFSNPCNPTGSGAEEAVVEEFIRFCEKHGVLVILDEVYMDFFRRPLLGRIREHENLCVLKSTSKAMGLAGLRVGFVVAREELIRLFKTVKSPFNCNSFSQMAAAEMLAYPGYRDRALGRILKQTDRLRQILAEFCARTEGLAVLDGSQTNFVLAEGEKAAQLHRRLLDKSIAVRKVGPTRLRITAGSPRDHRILEKALEDILKEGW
ncbi:MAG: histidinol-phosphate aminotransferase family protein [Clostridia bacterium]|nr:histidinol-phosphate aminotransferase family protein [Clostridia bacterium]